MNYVQIWPVVANGCFLAAALCGWMSSEKQGWVLIFTHIFAALFGASAAVSVLSWVTT